MFRKSAGGFPTRTCSKQKTILISSDSIWMKQTLDYVVNRDLLYEYSCRRDERISDR